MSTEQLCPCGSANAYDKCCGPILAGTAEARTPEELMRARFTAHGENNYDFLMESVHPDYREDLDVEELSQWSGNISWDRLEVHSASPGDTDDDGLVSFTAHYHIKGKPQFMREDGTFKRVDGKWYYVDGEVHGQEPYIRDTPKVGRNEPCPCNSGKKFKKCCGA